MPGITEMIINRSFSVMAKKILPTKMERMNKLEHYQYKPNSLKLAQIRH